MRTLPSYPMARWGGRQLRETAKLPDLSVSKVSVITVAYQAKASLKATMASVRQQNYPSIEYIVVDGGSTDGTVELLESSNNLDLWVSGADGGIYEGMNRGLELATGEWVVFMNAGDTFHEPATLTLVMAECQRVSPDIWYGNWHVRGSESSDGVAFDDSPHNYGKNVWKGDCFSHQAMVSRLAYHRRHPFDTTIRINADLKYFWDAVTSGAKVHYQPLVAADIQPDGFSARQTVSCRERAELFSQDPNLDPHEVHQYFRRYLRKVRWKAFLKALLPRGFRRAVREWRHP